MPDTEYDAVIIGGGHNGLVCAGYLAKAGKKVLVLEANDNVGGMAASHPFADGYTASVAQTLPQLSTRLIKDLNLKQHGFELAHDGLPTTALDIDGNHIQINGSSLHGVSDQDNKAYLEFIQMMEKYCNAVKPFWGKTPPRIGSGNWQDNATLAQFGWKLRTLGKTDMAEFMRVIALPAQDLMDEFFDSPLLKAALSWDFNVGNKLAPRSPNNAILNQLLRNIGDLAPANSYNSGAMPLPKGGMGGFVSALQKSVESLGVSIQTSCRVQQVVVEDHQIRGVLLENGKKIECPCVISNADPKTSFFKLLGARHLEVQFAHRINRNRNKGMVAKLHLALDDLPGFNGLKQINGRLLITPSMAYIESAYDHAKYGEMSEQLAMEILIPSIQDPSLAPAGKHVLSANIQYVPYEIKGGWQQHKPALLENALSKLEQYAPGIRQRVTAHELLTPQDLEAKFNVEGGHWHHTELCIDQWWMNRPTYGASQYKTPVSGFYLCGAGSHPGGGVMGLAGKNAAAEVIKHDNN